MTANGNTQTSLLTHQIQADFTLMGRGGTFDAYATSMLAQ